MLQVRTVLHYACAMQRQYDVMRLLPCTLYTARADYVSGSFPVLYFELTRRVSLYVTAAFWLEKDEFKYA